MRANPETLRALLAWAVGIALLYAAFEVGRVQAGYFALDAFQQRRALAGRVTDLEQEKTTLERRLAAEDVTRRIDQQAQTEAMASIGELQAELARQQQELEFYRGLVAEKFGASTLKVQELAIQRGAEPGQFTIEITLVQTASRNALTRGTLSLSVAGQRGTALAQLPLADLREAGAEPIPFTLRFFRTLEVPVTLPADFAPSSVEVEFRSDRTGPEPVTQSFPWAPALVEPGDGSLTPAAAAE